MDLIGAPFVYGGRGEDGTYDCYGLIKELLRRDGQEIPDYLSPCEGHKITAIFMGELRLWRECAPKPGAILLFKIPGNLHVGYALNGDAFVHTWEKSGGVLVERLSDGWEDRLMGIYEYVG